MTIPFVKMHGAANDFVVIDHREPFLGAALEDLVSRLCDRRRGVGADGVLLLERDPEADFAMRYFNADGRSASYCGNGARCLARLGLDLGLGRSGTVRFRTDAGVQTARRSDTGVAVDFGRVVGPGAPETLAAAGRTFTGRLVRAGVPHFVVDVARVADVPVDVWGAALRGHAHFGPEGANVDFIARMPGARVAMRTFERGVEGETLACGSGAIASAVSAVVQGDASPIAVLTAGGDTLTVTLTPSGSNAWDVSLEGPVVVAFEGEWREPVAMGASRAPATGRGIGTS